MRGVGDVHLLEENERIGIAQKPRVVEGIDHAPLGEDPPVGVADPPLQLGQVVRAEVDDLGVAQGDQTGLDMLGQGVVLHGMMNQAAGQVELAHRRPRPVDHGRRQDALDSRVPGRTRPRSC